MASFEIDPKISLRIPADMMDTLKAHLYPGDCDEHGAAIGASLVTTSRGTRFLANRLYIAKDGIDYVEGNRGYRMLTASFVRECALDCVANNLAYLPIHCHSGSGSVSFSQTDLASHMRGYPALLDILDGLPVCALVFANNAVAGEIWLPNRQRFTLSHAEIVGRPVRRIYPMAPSPNSDYDERYDRQARLLGDAGQNLLASQKVGVIGAGGAGSLIIEYLARLGVGEIVVIDPDRIEPSNLSRVIGSTVADTRPLLSSKFSPKWLREIGANRRTFKVNIARRVALAANPKIKFHAVAEDVLYEDVAKNLIDCDYIFLAADKAQVRLLFNAVVHQYLIPGVQVGAKANISKVNGDILDLFSVVRPIIPGRNCLWCNELISRQRLQNEAISPDERTRQRYVDEEEVAAPSVITLNAISAADAVNDYLMTATGLLQAQNVSWKKYLPRSRKVIDTLTRQDSDCTECSSPNGRLGQGHNMRLPVH